MSASGTQASQKQFPCRQCGAKLEFQPGAGALKCPYCGVENAIADTGEQVEELDFEAGLDAAGADQEHHEQITVKCQACAAESTLEPDVTASHCPFCGAGIVAEGVSTKAIKPKALLPFKVTQAQAFADFKRWIEALWFAPSELKRYAQTEQRLAGVYVPYWTYDAETDSAYTGERGDDYWATETYTARENGRSVTKTRSVKKTRWHSVSGTVQDSFDDILILASRSLPAEYAEKLEPWDLPDLVPYQDEFLSGFRAESYQVDLKEGFGQAKTIMYDTICDSIRSDIGGDHQRIGSVQTRYSDVTFKHVLLPVWISAYRYREKVFRILVNARTGEVQGERPWSWVKIALAVLAGVGLIAGLIALVYSS